MNRIISFITTLIFVIYPFNNSDAQNDTTIIGALDFYGNEVIKVEGCEYSDYKVKCQDEFVQWIDLNKVPLNLRQLVIQDFRSKIEEQINPKKSMEIEGISFEQKVVGLLYYSKIDGKEKYFILFDTEFNGNPVILYMGLLKEPINNEDLPIFANHFFQLN